MADNLGRFHYPHPVLTEMSQEMLKYPCWPLEEDGSPLGKGKLGCQVWTKLLVTQPRSGVKAGDFLETQDKRSASFVMD